MNDLKFSVCMPAHNKGKLIGETIKSVLAQTYTNYEIIVSDNDSQDNTEDVVKVFKDQRIRYFRNAVNVGFSKNLELCKERASGDILFLLSPKNVIAKDALLSMYNAFKLSDDIGAVVLPYYWYGKDVNIPVRAKALYDKEKNTVISIHDCPKAIIAAFKIVDNPSSLAYRKDYIDMPFHKDPFVEFVYPFASILKKHKVVLLKNYTMACPAWVYSGSQDHIVYKKSPMQCWVGMFNTIFYEPEFNALKERCIKDFVAVNYVGLAQVKNYGGFNCLIREIFQLTRYKKTNLFSIKFWIFSIGSLLIPAFFLKRLVVFFKRGVNTKFLKNIRLGV